MTPEILGTAPAMKQSDIYTLYIYIYICIYMYTCNYIYIWRHRNIALNMTPKIHRLLQAGEQYHHEQDQLQAKAKDE